VQLLLAGVLAAVAPAPAEDLVLVRDLDSSPPPLGPVSSAGSEFMTFQGELYFQGCTGFDCELWKTDGSMAGTSRVADIVPGSVGSQPKAFTVVGSTLFFVATTGLEGSELWRSDGTETGTALVRDIRPGGASSLIGELTPVGSTLYFTANDGTSGVELWRSDGTVAGTTLVSDIRPGSASSVPVFLAPLGGLLLFAATDASTGREPWVSDGTPAGTQRLADTRNGLSGGMNPLSTSRPQFATLGGTAFFGANDGSHLGLWSTDGTPGGTAKVVDLVVAGEVNDRVIGARTIGSGVYLAHRDFTAGSYVATGGLWYSDGTAPGTLELATFETSLERTGPLTVPVEVGGTAYFIGSTRDLGSELWRSDGTLLGTELVKDVWPGAADGVGALFASPVGLLLGAKHPEVGYEPWFSDGTEGGTHMLRDTFPGPANGGVQLSQVGAGPGVLGAEVFFLATDSTSLTSALWRSDGTPVGTTEAFVIGAPSASGGRPWELAPFGDRILFSARDGVIGREPWISDGSFAGTASLGDLAAGASGSDPRYFAEVGSIALFSAWTPGTGRELFATDGTPGGTALVADLVPGSDSSSPAELTTLGGLVVFRACEPAGGCELWSSDGTAPGTTQIADLLPGTVGSFPEQLTAAAGKILFRATTPSSGTELWVTDGTEAGTSLLAEIAPGALSSLPQALKGAAARVFFTADDGVHGLEIWTSDGTPAGTQLTRDVAPGAADSVYANAPDHSAMHDGLLYFAAFDDGFATCSDPWKSDGSFAGTQKVREMNDFDPSGGGSVQWMGSGGSFLWFGFIDGTTFDWEPYRTDGSSDGTSFVEDLFPGTPQSRPYGWLGFEGNAYFSARGAEGIRLWRGSGHPFETVALGPSGPDAIVPTIVPPSAPLIRAGSRLLLNATTTSDGNELFAYSFPILITSFESGDFSAWDLAVGSAP